MEALDDPDLKTKTPPSCLDRVAAVLWVWFSLICLSWELCITGRTRRTPEENDFAGRLQKYMAEPDAVNFAKDWQRRGKFMAERIKEALVLKNGRLPDPREIDFVTGAGGWRCQYTIGVWTVLRHLEFFKIKRYAGGSTGATACLAITYGIHDKLVNLNYAWRKLMAEEGKKRRLGHLEFIIVDNSEFLDLFKSLGEACLEPEVSDAHKRGGSHDGKPFCDGVDMVSAELTIKGFKEWRMGPFQTYAQLETACLCTTAIPLFNAPLKGYKWDCPKTGKTHSLMDGAYAKFCPLFTDKQRPQFAVDLWKFWPAWNPWWMLRGPTVEQADLCMAWAQEDIFHFLTDQRHRVPWWRRFILYWWGVDDKKLPHDLSKWGKV